MKKVIFTVLSIFVVTSTAFSWTNGDIIENVSGQIKTMWVSPFNGDYSVYVTTSTINRSMWNGSTWVALSSVSISPNTTFCVIIPSASGANKNSLALVLAARMSGLPINIGFNKRTSNSTVTISGYCDISY